MKTVWVLLVFYSGGGGIFSVPMESKQVCEQAMMSKDFGHYFWCLNTSTGEVIK